MVYAVIRVRGSIGVKGEILATMKMLRLHKVNHMVLVPETPSVKGMLQKAKDYITWGEIDEGVLADVVSQRLKMKGDKPVDDETLKDITGKNVKELAKELATGEVSLRDYEVFKPVFRLHPPRKGYEGIKRPYRMGGALGYRGKDINDLIRRMI